MTLTTEAILQLSGRGHAPGQLDVEPEVLGGGSCHEGEGEGEELHGEVREAGGHCTAAPTVGALLWTEITDVCIGLSRTNLS